MTLREEIGTNGFKRGLGTKPMFFVLLDFNWDTTYKKWYDGKNKVTYNLLPAWFPQNEDIRIKKGVKGWFKLSNSCIDKLADALKGFDDKPANQNMYGWYDPLIKKYHLKRLESNLLNVHKDLIDVTIDYNEF